MIAIFKHTVFKQRLCLIIPLFYLSLNLSSQTYPQSSLYLIDLYQVNPAYAGLERSLSINLNYRDQWAGFESNPRDFHINAHLPVYLFDGGMGATIVSDQLGPLHINSFEISYNRIMKREFGIISAGLSLGLRNTSLDGSALITPDGIYRDGVIDHQDPFLNDTQRNTIGPHYALGLFLGTRKFELGLSVFNMFTGKDALEGIEINSQGAINLFGRSSYRVNDFVISPSILIKTNLISMQTDLSCLAKNGNVFGGVSLRGYSSRSIDSIVFLGGIRINEHYTLTYGYDMGLSALRRFSQGAHEININYNLNKLLGIGLPPEIIYNPRNL